MSNWLLALFLSLLSLHLGMSMELPVVIWTGTSVSVLAALRFVAIERPTLGLLFVLFSSGMLIGNQVLEDWALEGSWPAENGVGAGFILCLLIYLLWVFAAKTRTALYDSSHPLDRDNQNILAWGLLLMLLMSPPDNAVVTWFDVAVAPISLAAILVAAAVLLLDRCAGLLLPRLALLSPLLFLAPLSMLALESAQGPVIAALGDLFPRSSNFSPTGFSPNQQLRASIFLRPSNRAVMRIQADASPVKYLAGNRLTLLDQDLVWQAEERPLLVINSFSADPAEAGNYRYPMENHHVTNADDGSQSMKIHELANENYIFMTPGTGYVTGSFDSLIRNAADVWTPEFERGADRRWQLDPGNDSTADISSPATLQLPDFWDAGLQERSQSLSGATPALTVENVLAYFQARPYSLSTNFDPEQPFHDFFLNERAGYCFWFASAAALALRANGVPSRLVGGYVIHEQLSANLWLVRERDAHSWVEWQDEQGFWHTIDPTPATLFGFFNGYESSTFSVWYHRLASQWQILIDRVFANALIANLITWGGLLVLAFLFVREYRRIRQANATGASVAQQWRDMWLRFLQLTKLPDNSDWTASTYAAQLPTDWPEPWRTAVKQFLDDYNRHRFAADPDRSLAAVEGAMKNCAEVLSQKQTRNQTRK